MNIELLLAAALAAATPVLYAGFGELLAEKAGVLNLGLEGVMLIGAVSGFIGAQGTGSVWGGLWAALAAAGLFSLLFAALVITLRLDQVVTGLAFTILGAGLSAFLGAAYVGLPPTATVTRPDLGVLSDLPVVGPVLLAQDWMVYGAIAVAVLIGLFVQQTRPGLILRTLGESPDVLDALGMRVIGLRYLYVLLGGMLAGLGGAYLSLAFTPSWIQNMTAGRGWIAIALVVFSVWRPSWLFGGAMLFGVVDAFRFRAQIGGEPFIDPRFLNMLPYVMTLVVLAVVGRSVQRRRIGVPATLAIPYDRERR